jgi:hypothetical protein
MGRKSKFRQQQHIFLVALVLLAGVSASALFGARHGVATSGQSAAPKSEKAFQLSSTSFDADSAIPLKYACTGANISPALAWTEPPANTQSFALIVDDPDASSAAPAVHWLIYAIPLFFQTVRPRLHARPESES